MKAILCKAWGAPETLVVEELPDISPAPGQVVVDVQAAGVNSRWCARWYMGTPSCGLRRCPKV